MSESMQTDGPAPTDGGKAPRSIPMAAIAGAVVLIGLVAFALYRRGAAPVAPADSAEVEHSAERLPDDGTAPAGTPIVAVAPIRLTPEASILSERYRCICGCNDTLPVCTCRNDPGSETMKSHLQELVNQGKSPQAVDEAMVAKFGEACLLSHKAPPQTMPSHADPNRKPAAGS